MIEPTKIEPPDAIDRFLLAHGVFFLPWVGCKYSLGFNERRFLVLGDSHYDKWDGVRHRLENNFTRGCISAVIARSDGALFWRNVEQALLNKPRNNGWALGGEALWKKLAFYNFLKFPISGGPRIRAEWKQYEESRKPFRAVLEQLRPDRVLVCGKGLWQRMEEITREDDFLHDDVKAYRLADGTKVWCFATVAPSSGRYSWKRLYPLIMAFLDDPQEVAATLRDRPIASGTQSTT